MALNINGTTGISGVDGSASAPALTGTDSNTGINFASDTVKINTGGVTRATVDSAGRVGIGVSDVSDYWEGGDQLVVKDTGTGGCGITIHADTDDESGIFFADGTAGNAKYEGYIQYSHSDNSMRLATSAVERMRIYSTGVVQVMSEKLTLGTSVTTGGASSGNFVVACDGSSANPVKLRNTNTGSASQNMIVFVRSSSEVGSITTNNSSTSYNTSSDYRLKENVTAISDGITRLKTLKPSKFNFIGQSKTVDGFLAHEVTAVPEAITGTKDEVATEDIENKGIKKDDPIYQQIDQAKLVPLLTAALQEAIAKIETLETKVAALEAG